MDDPDLREILKEVSRFSSYPQLFVEMKFIGGLNFLKNARDHGGLASIIPSTEVMLPMKEKIQQLVKKGRIMVFLDGTIDFPTTIESKAMLDIIKHPKYTYSKKDLNYFDLKQDDEIRPALLDHSKYRVTPQLYVDGKLVGGVDIV